MSVSPPSSAARPTLNSAAPTQVDPPRPARRLPAGARGPGEGDRDQPDRDVDVEHPAPGGAEPLGDPGVGQPGARERGVRVRWTRGSRRPTNGPAAMPRNVSAPMTPSARARACPSNRWLAAAVPTGTRIPPPTRLDEPGDDELVEALGAPGQRRPGREATRPTRNIVRTPCRSARRPASGIVTT